MFAPTKSRNMRREQTSPIQIEFSHLAGSEVRILVSGL